MSWDWIGRAHDLQSRGASFAIVTVTGVKGSTPQFEGAKMIVLPSGEFYGTIGGGRLEQLAISDGLKYLAVARSGQSSESNAQQKSVSLSYPLCFRTGQCCGGAEELFFEIIGSQPELYLFGAGHVGQELCQVLEGTPFVVHLIDPRDEWLSRDSLPMAVRRHGIDWRKFVSAATWSSVHTFVAVMTHDHELDLDIVSALLNREPVDYRYLGLIGSQTKRERFAQRLRDGGIAGAAIERLRCPIGLPIGQVKAPRAIAVSIAAELLRVLNERAF